jgi:hypothetical protein
MTRSDRYGAPDHSHLSFFTHLYSSSRLVRQSLFIAIVAASALLFLAACGPTKSDNSQEQLTSDTQQIATTFAATNDLETARSALRELPVANPNQWLIFVAETAIADAGTEAVVDQALTRLALALGLHTPILSDFAAANGLIEPDVVVGTTGAASSPVVNAPLPASTSPTDSATGATTLQAEAVAETTGDSAETAIDAQTATPTEAPTDEPTQTLTPEAKPIAQAASIVNLRSGPGTNYDLAGSLQATEPVEVIAKNGTGDWWQVRLASGSAAWVYAPLVTVTGSADGIAIAADIPTPPPAPPTATPAPVVQAAPADTPTPAVIQATATPAPAPSDKPHFTLVQRRLWNKEENGGCGGQHLLRIHVLDANGNRVNGVALQGIYTGEVFVTGAQGKGDGIIEFDLYGPGEGFRVMRDNDGREATSDNAEGFTTISPNIDVPTLIGAGYCTDQADCDVFYYSYGCSGHHSWEATFKRNY